MLFNKHLCHSSIDYFINWVILFLLIFKASLFPNSQSLEPKSLTKFSSPPVCHVTHVMCHVKNVRCQVPGVICQVSHVTCNSQTVRARELKFWEKFHLLPHVTCQVSHVKCNLKSGKNDDASRCRVCYQQGLPRLVS